MSEKIGGLAKTKSLLLGTKVLSGSKLYFLFIKLLRYLSKRSRIWHLVFRRLALKNPRSLIIKNGEGIFRVCPEDDSMDKVSPYYEPLCRSWLLQGGRPNLFIDIGANVGIYTITALNRYNYQKAVCFEPNANVYTMLQENIRLNGLESKANAFNLALGEICATLPFYSYRSHTGQSRFILDEDSLLPDSDYEIAQINTIPFDDFVTKCDVNIAEIDFIKIDVEEFEYSVLKGMRKTLHSVHDVKLLIEIDPRHAYKQRTTSLLREAGFELQQQIGANYLFTK